MVVRKLHVKYQVILLGTFTEKDYFIDFLYKSMLKFDPPPFWPLSQQTNFPLTNLIFVVARKLHA